MSKPIVRTFVCDEIHQKHVPPEPLPAGGGARRGVIRFEQRVTLRDIASDSTIVLQVQQFDGVEFAPGKHYQLTVAEQPPRTVASEAPAS